ncbi:MAG: septum formation initiator family protein [Alphaproteobacteria bacterium]|nr:septum formation initiator family protein [Alphaproteobacteria bacterium]
MILPKPHLFTFLCLLVITYFVYHGIWGNRGLFRLIEIQDEISEAQEIARKTVIEKEALTQKTDALKNHNALDKDVLEEEAARVLNMIDENDVVILN